MSTRSKPTTITLAGAGPEAERWAAALRGVEGTEADRIGCAGEDELLEGLSRAGVDAVAFVAPMPDLPVAIKRAAMARRHVFVAGPAALTSRQLLAIHELARRRERVVLFDTATLGDEHTAFIKKMTGGPHALWRPRYLRALRTGAAEERTLDDVAIREIGRVLELAGGLPARVSAMTPRVDDETGAADVAMVAMTFDGGPVARVDVSLVELEPREEIVIGCDGRTIVLNPLDARAPLQIQAGARYRAPRHAGQWAETVSEYPLGEAPDRLSLAAAAFVEAVRRNEAGTSNARAAACAALVWETARESMTRDGESLALPADGVLVRRGRPELHVIEGGGHTLASYPAPELTIVARR